jgi:hypothetical protein
VARLLPKKVKWFGAQKRRASVRRSPHQLVALRLNDLARLFRARYGVTLPDDDAGRDDAVVMLHHLARAHGDARRMRSWLQLNAPWMAGAEGAELVNRVLQKPLRWRADTLAKRLRLTEAERRRLRICTIGCVDMTKQERQQARKLRQRQRDRARRRAQGAKLRAEYEAGSINRTRPWIAAGISRRTWYRRRGTGPSAL